MFLTVRLMKIHLALLLAGIALSVGTLRAGSLEQTIAAAKKGEAAAQYALGLRYARGEGLNEDASEAAKWFLEAAEQGHADAQMESL